MSAANDLSGEARNLRDQAAASAGRVADDTRQELERLRNQVERLMRERVTPALGEAAEAVEGYSRRARETFDHQADVIATTVRERPLLAIGIAAVGGYLIGRLLSGNGHSYPPRDER